MEGKINSDRILNSSMMEMKRGYTENEVCFECLICGFRTEKGIVYQADGVLYEAERFMKGHIGKAHVSVFDWLIELDKKDTGLSDHQKSLLKLFHEGKSDAEIQKKLGIGSGSTIRNHRFAFKEKERQAKLFLILMELLKEDSGKDVGLLPPHSTAKMVDDRYAVTDSEAGKIIGKYFTGDEGKLKTFSMKEKSKLVILKHIMKRFDEKKIYNEKEVNEILKEVYEDFATIRRYLIEYGFMDRKANGSRYWVRNGVVDSSAQGEIKHGYYAPGKEEDMSMDRKRELIMQYKEIKTEAGVYQIRNKINGKILVVSTPNIKTINGKKFELNMGSSKYKLLQDEWNKFGEDSFEFELLEKLEKKEDVFQDIKEELKKLESKWLDKLQPYGDKGYNPEKT